MRFLRDAYRGFSVINPARHGAALAYYGLFSLVPLLAVGYSMVRRLLSEEALAILLATLGRMGGVVGPETIAAIEQQVEETARRVGGGSVVVTLSAVLVLLYTASGAFAQLKYSLNTIWDVPHETQLRARSMVVTRLMGVGLVLAVGILLVLSVFANILVGSLGALLGLGTAAPLLNGLASLLLIAGSFTVLYRLLPDAAVTWRAAVNGGALASVGVIVALAVVNLYFRYVRLNTALSVAGGLAVILIVTNYLAQIFLFGAIVTRRTQRPGVGAAAETGTRAGPSASG
jgi:membrane protein